MVIVLLGLKAVSSQSMLALYLIQLNNMIDQQVVIMRISQDFKEEQMTDKGDLKCAEMACGILCVSRILANKMLQ